MSQKRKIEIMDTTLRDGEQTSGVSFSTREKLTIAQLLLEELKVDRIEIASTRVSNGEFESVKSVTNWAKKNGYLDKVEVLNPSGSCVKSDHWHSSLFANIQRIICSKFLFPNLGFLDISLEG